MIVDSLRSLTSRRPEWVVGAWLALAVAVGLFAPNLTRLAAEGQARLLGRDAESLRAAELIGQSWPELAYESLAVVALHREGGLCDADREFGRRMARRFEGTGRPAEILRVLGPGSDEEVARRLVSEDETLQLVVVPLASPFVAPTTQEAVSWLRSSAKQSGLSEPAGLEVVWTGDAVLGRDYMASVQTSLDRAAAATVVLLLIVLLVVYRSVWMALVPLVTIGICLVISRGVLAWMVQAGWEISPLVELFLVALLFGTGTDFCLFISWRYGEHWSADNPAGAMDETLRRSFVALATSAGTVIAGLALMGTTRFKLFSSTGPSVAIGLALTLVATLTLTPALLVLLARLRPRAFAGMTGPSSGVWEWLGRKAMERPVLSWAAALLVMVPLAIVSARSQFVQDLMTELPGGTRSARGLELIAAKFGPGMTSPLTVVLDSNTDLRGSEGLALIDDVSRFLARQRRLVEVRSATQPLGRGETLARARLDSRLGEVNDGFARMSAGAEELRKGLTEGAAKLRAALWLQEKTGLNLTEGTPEAPPAAHTADRPSRAGETLALGFRKASAALLGTSSTVAWAGHLASPTEGSPDPDTQPKPGGERPQDVLLRELTRAADGAGQIRDGTERARKELSTILKDPVGRRALDRLLIDGATVRENPDLRRSFAAYISPDGRRARVDLVQADRIFSGGAMDQVQTLRGRLNDFLDDAEGMDVTASIAGANAESADIRALTRSDQLQSWFLVPAGVFVVLLIALRDPLTCANLVATMLLTYAFALGATHVVFVTLLGAPGIDWKVPYFLFVLLVAVGVDYNVFLMDRVREETARRGLRSGIVKAIGRTGGLITSAAAITACSFASFLTSPLASLRQLGFALVVGITLDALLVRPFLVPCGHWLLSLLRRPGSPALPVRTATASRIALANRGD